MLSFPLGKEAVLPRQLLTFPPAKEAILLLAIAHLPPGEGSNSPLAIAGSTLLPSTLPQLLTFLLVKEAIHPPCSQSSTLLPSREGSSSSQAIAHLPLGEGSSISQATAHLPLGKVTVLPRQVNQAIKLGQSGKALGSLPGIGHPRLPRRIALSPRKTTSPLPPPVGFPKGLLMKNLTLSGSLTFPTNL